MRAYRKPVYATSGTRLTQGLNWVTSISVAGLAVSMFLAWDNPLLPPMLGLSLVLVFFVGATTSITGLAAVRMKNPLKSSPSKR